MGNNELLQDIGNILGCNIDLQQDMIDIKENIRSMFQEKYINRVQSLVNQNKSRVETNPTKEIALLQALKPFIGTEMHWKIDKLTETMNSFRTIQLLNDKMQTAQPQRSEKKEEKILKRSDGVYEIDEVCMKAKEQGSGGGFIIFIFIIFMLMGKPFYLGDFK